MTGYKRKERCVKKDLLPGLSEHGLALDTQNQNHPAGRNQEAETPHPVGSGISFAALILLRWASQLSM